MTVHGFSVHPGSAKNSMINAQNVAMEFHAALPAFSRPEHTEGREGFFHLTSMQGDVTTAHLATSCATMMPPSLPPARPRCSILPPA